MAEESWRWTGTDEDVAEAVKQLELDLMVTEPRLCAKLANGHLPWYRRRPQWLRDFMRLSRQMRDLMNEIYCLPGVPRKPRPRP
jgi:hypothetical protein